MPYIKSVVVAGKTIETKKYHSSRYGKKITRGKNKNKTPESMAKVNRRNTATRLRQKMNAHFKHNDIHISLTYLKGKSPVCAVGFVFVQIFLRLVRNYCKKKNITLKYVWVTGIGKKTGAVHHHVVMSYVDLRVLQGFWPHGKLVLNAFLDNTGEYSKLAEYLLKNYYDAAELNHGIPPHKKKYNSSKNMFCPEPTKEIINRYEMWSKTPKAIKGYIVLKDSIVNGVDEITGCPFQYYMMIKIE